MKRFKLKMKRKQIIYYVLIVGLVVVLSSCLSGDKTNTVPGTTIKVENFIYNGHKYIMFGNYQSVVHDPDCPCKNKF